MLHFSAFFYLIKKVFFLRFFFPVDFAAFFSDWAWKHQCPLRMIHDFPSHNPSDLWAFLWQACVIRVNKCKKEKRCYFEGVTVTFSWFTLISGTVTLSDWIAAGHLHMEAMEEVLPELILFKSFFFFYIFYKLQVSSVQF